MKEQRDGPLLDTTTDVRSDFDHLVRHRAKVSSAEVSRAEVSRGEVFRAEVSRMDPGRALIDSVSSRGASDGARLARVFKTRAEALGMRVQETSRTELRRVIDGLVAHYGPAVISPSLIATFPELEGVGDSTPDDPRLSIAACGLTGVEYAIAETGSLVLASGGSRWRHFSSVPPVHVAVIERTRLVPDLLDVLLAYGGRRLPPGFVVVTGPGRAAETETLKRTHRPATVECVLVD